MDDKYEKAVQEQRAKREFNRTMAGLDNVVREARRSEMKRWGQSTCERCGGPLNTYQCSDGSYIRVCDPCEQKAIDNDATRSS